MYVEKCLYIRSYTYVQGNSIGVLFNELLAEFPTNLDRFSPVPRVFI